MPGALLWQVLLRWVRTANVHVRRVKQGTPSTHPAAGVPRPSQLPGCGALYRAAADAVQEFLAGVTLLSGLGEWVCSPEQQKVSGRYLRGAG